jgi:hypothetical protein
MPTGIRVAVLDEQIPAQLRERPRDADGLDLIWSGTDVEELRRFAAQEPPTVIVADLDLLGTDPAGAAEELLRATAAELFVTVYKFAPRGLVANLVGGNRRALKAPVSIPMLKTQMMSAIVRGLLAGEPAPTPAQPPTVRPIPRAKPPEPVGDPPRYSDAQLGTLRERQSRLACECPNHVAELVSSLLAFERYSRACANRDDDDARMHRRLATSTASARRVMEDALTELLKFENISV